ncbi:MAG: hypothetical protein E7435_01125 [Ruminococcaceae bacterium]|nr:hypothetical protein [Oscillospiraceae bacterium]
MKKIKNPIPEEYLDILKKIWSYVKIGGQWIYKLRSVVLAIPVVIAAISLAIDNAARLPVFVGINLQANGEYAMMIERNVAVMVPLLITVGSLLMMFLSRKVLYPWLVSVFSLVIPVLLWITNIFPG